MNLASLALSPLLLVSFALSDPARSIKLRTETLTGALFFEGVIVFETNSFDSITNRKIVCALELFSFISVDPM